MTIRDKVLPAIDKARSVIQRVGLRRYAVTIRRRVWSGTYPGDGTPVDQDIVISPLPRVRNSFGSANLSPAALQYIVANGNVIDDRYYKIDRITPSYLDRNNTPGGYSPLQLRTVAGPDLKNVEEIVVLVGDDGVKRDCVQVSFEQDRSFGYTMLVHESDRPRAALTSLAIAAVPPVAAGSRLPLTATGTFSDGTTSSLTSIVVWSSATPAKATIDLLGNVTGVATGTSVITASLTGISATITITVL